MAEKIVKKDWVSRFTLVGTPVIGDYTFKIDEKSTNSNWIYNALNLGVYCGEECGTVYAECIGGYSEDNENRIYAHGKKDDKTDDFESQIIVAWEDRFNDAVLEEIGDMSFINVGLEKTKDGKTYYKKFLSAYDAIAYVKECLTENMVVNVSGNIKYSLYNDTVQVKKNITSIALSKVTKEEPEKYRATFTQSILIDKDSVDLKNIDKNKGVVYVNARVLDYVKEVNDTEVKSQYPFNKVFEYAFPDIKDGDNCKAIYDLLFKVKKGVTQITMEGKFIEGGAVVEPTWDDVPEDIKKLVALKVITKEDALARCATNGNREKRMVFTAPATKQVGDDDKKTLIILKFEERYTEEDLILDCMFKEIDSSMFEELLDEEVEVEDDMAWLNAL